MIAEVSTSVPNVALNFIQCDQLSLDSVQTAAKTFLSHSPSRLDILICNAGVMATSPALSTDGFENQFAVNHLAHALLVKILLPALTATTDARVLFITSTGFNFPFPGGIQFDTLNTTQDLGPYSQWARYGQSKLANVQYAATLAREHPAITWLSVHPGVVETDLVGRLKPEEKEMVYSTNQGGLLKPEQGAHSTLWAATVEKKELVNGDLYVPVGVKGEHSKESQDVEQQTKLWEWTAEVLKKFA